jgi:acyl-CoA dehydrogenase
MGAIHRPGSGRKATGMPYLLTDEQQQISQEARRLLGERYSGERLKTLLETRGGYDEGFWAACREMGWTAVTVPEAYGGLGLGAVELCLIALECGRVAAGAPFLAASFAVGEAIRLWGDEDAKTRLLPSIASGETKGAVAFGEGPGDAIPSRPSVRFDGGRLSGTKRWVVGGAAADLALVLAADADGSPCLVVADLAGDGVTRTSSETIDNSRCTADLSFDRAAATRLQANDAMAAARAVQQRLAVVTAFEQLGGAETCLELGCDYARQRFAFGQPIGRFQAIKHKMAEMYVNNELARGNALRAAQAVADEAGDLPQRAAAARLTASAAYEYAAAEAIQVHGAVGVTWEHDLHLHYRRARATALELGAAAAWEDLIVDALGEAA